MRVRAEYGGNAAIEIASHRLFLRRGLAVNVDNDHFDRVADLLQLAIGGVKRVVARRHEYVAHELHHRHVGAAGGLTNHFSLARIASRVIRRPDHVIVVIVVIDELFFVPDVIAGRVRVNRQLRQLLHNRFGHPEAAGGVLDVDDREVDLLAVDHVLELLMQCAPARLADHIADV